MGSESLSDPASFPSGPFHTPDPASSGQGGVGIGGLVALQEGWWDQRAHPPNQLSNPQYPPIPKRTTPHQLTSIGFLELANAGKTGPGVGLQVWGGLGSGGLAGPQGLKITWWHGGVLRKSEDLGLGSECAQKFC